MGAKSLDELERMPDSIRPCGWGWHRPECKERTDHDLTDPDQVRQLLMEGKVTINQVRAANNLPTLHEHRWVRIRPTGDLRWACYHPDHPDCRALVDAIASGPEIKEFFDVDFHPEERLA